jgi:putative hydrolase of the HAD superfamily
MKPHDGALILDFGGVISRTLFETHALTEKALNLPVGTLDWRGPFDPATDALWRAMQEDAISERDYWRKRTREVAGLAGRDWTEMSDFVKAARGDAPDAVIRPEARAAIERAKAAGFKLAILSNELDLFYGAGFREKLPFLSEFDVIQDATYTDILKPDPRAYANCLAALNLAASDCVFVDDQPRNVEGASRAGLKCVQFDVKNPQQSFNTALGLLGLNLESTS